MDSMQGDGNSLRDIKKDVKDTSLSIKDTAIFVSINKADKLITALYMVTDIMDTNEPLKYKLRNLGLEVLSEVRALKDMHNQKKVCFFLEKLDLVLSCLNIASTIGIISAMNGTILSKEFSLLKEAIKDTNPSMPPYVGEPNLEEFLNSSLPSAYVSDTSTRHDFSISRTRLGVQKGGTLMQAITDKMSLKNQKFDTTARHKENFEQLKKDRKNEILLIIKTKNLEQISKGLPLGVTITDIKSSAKAVLKDTSEKTLQRELMSLIGDGVLYKEGSKRWSKYFVK